MWRKPAIRGVFALMSCSAMVAAVAGCTPSTVTPDACPDHFTAGVVWTSPTARSSAIQLFDGNQVVAEIPIGVQGISPTDQAPVYHDGKVGFLAMGDEQNDRTHLVTMSLTTCEVSLAKVDEPAINIGSIPDGFAAVGNINGVSYLRRFQDTRNLPMNATFESQFVTAIHSVDGYIYAQTDNVVTNETALAILRADDLSETRRVPLPVPSGETSFSMTAARGKIVIPLAFHGDNEDDRLLLIDQTDLSAHTIKLASRSPFYVRSVGDTVYVAHTFLNSAFHPPSYYRHISVVNMADETFTDHELPTGISQFDVTGATLAILGEKSNGSSMLHTYALPDFSPMVSIGLKAPTGVPNAYAATVFLPQS